MPCKDTACPYIKSESKIYIVLKMIINYKGERLPINSAVKDRLVTRMMLAAAPYKTATPNIP